LAFDRAELQLRPVRASGRVVGPNQSGVTAEAIRNIESKKALDIFPAALQNEIFVKSKLRGKYQKDPIPTKENVWLRVIGSSCPSSFGTRLSLEEILPAQFVHYFNFPRPAARKKSLTFE
jgi:hypothetical protein